MRLPSNGSLNNLAHLYGVQTAYYDMRKRRCQSSPDSLLSILQALGAPVAALADVPQAYRERRQAEWRRLIEPVAVAWDGAPVELRLRLPESVAGSSLRCCLEIETGEVLSRDYSLAGLETLASAEVEGNAYGVKKITLPWPVPFGYHRLSLEIAGRTARCLVIAAPSRCYLPPRRTEKRGWGTFLPLYALHSERSWGSGDFSDLRDLTVWVEKMGGSAVATLPLLASYADDPGEPSPYLPASRLLWNEFYLDVNAVPELAECPAARAIMDSSCFQDEIEALNKLELVDYPRQMALKRRVLRELSGFFFSRESGRRAEMERFVEAEPVVSEYARFRAAREKYGPSWRSWPQHLRDGILKEADFNTEDWQYYLYAQWLARRQMESVLDKAGQSNVGLYLDLPVGVHPDGFDVWREREAFLPGVVAGAPPDPVFTRGQDWEFPPAHPEKIRETGYRYIIAYLRHHCRCAGILRVDHVMGFHRLFCIPKGMEAGRGVYVHYRAEELYAILALESHRNRTIIVGEDLGTVPPYVRPAMNQHRLRRMYVLHYELAENAKKGILPPSGREIASLNTHDMPPFAAFWRGADIEEWARMGLLDKAGERKERKNRENSRKSLNSYLRRKGLLNGQGAGALAVLRACLSFLAGSASKLVLVNLEDLWLETDPQNIPGTRDVYPNWRRRARYGLEEFTRMPEVTETLRVISSLRGRRAENNGRENDG